MVITIYLLQSYNHLLQWLYWSNYTALINAKTDTKQHLFIHCRTTPLCYYITKHIYTCYIYMHQPLKLFAQKS